MNQLAVDVVNVPAPAAAGRSLAEYGRLLRRRWVYLATIIPGVLAASILAAYLLPPKYRATGTIMLEPSSIPKEMVSSTVHDIEDVPAYAQQELELERRRIMTPEELVDVVKHVDPYPNRSDLTPEMKAQTIYEDTMVERVDPITFKPLDQSTAFSINYDNPDAHIAKKLANELVNRFITYNQHSRTAEATAAYEFLHSQAKQLETEMLGLEQQLAKFKLQYGSALPDMQTHNLSRMDSLQRDLDQTQQQLLVAQEKESQLQLQLNTLSPSLTAAVSDWRTQLAKLRSDLIDAQAKYTPEHPEVKRLQRAIADLQKQGAASSKIGAATPDNPDYLQIKSQLDSARGEVAGLQTSESRIRGDLGAYEKNLTIAPNVEREYTALARSYDNAHTRYEDLQTKMKNAALAQHMEEEQRGERFTLLHEPKEPTKPHFPNRLGIILLGVVLGSAIAFGVAALVDASDPTVRGIDDLQSIMEIQAVGTVPFLYRPEDKRRRRLRRVAAAAAYTAASVLVAVVVVLAH
jgi:polysaccharide chain length determinant protein (PEP-CTERM system associated)